ncbi:hypothetical protein CH252_40640 [Rhodococcus sp. 06-1477-1B]|nr:hypothetical protein CH252_40640 [Rhodococcus sp. 06-1477-1B]
MSQHSAKGAEWEAVRQFVLERDQWTCRYCGLPAKTVDHIIPISEGGASEPYNCVASCLPCNSRKGARPITRISGWADGWGPA